MTRLCLPLVFVFSAIVFLACSHEAVTNDGVPLDPDDCGCIVKDGVGVVPLACFCSGLAKCPTYEEAALCTENTGGLEVSLDVYGDCNLATVSYSATFYRAYQRVYDAKTHALVGASYSTDTLAYRCAAKNVAMIQGGTIPAPSCQVTSSEWWCTTFDGG